MKRFLQKSATIVLIITFLSASYAIFLPKKVSAKTIIYTSSSSFTIPLGVTGIHVYTNAAGGGGSATAGGGGGGCNDSSLFGGDIPVTPGDTYFFSVGSPGLGSSNGSDATDGGDTSFDGTLVAQGGKGALDDGTPGTGGGPYRTGGNGFSFANSNPNLNGGSSANCPALTGGTDGQVSGTPDPGDGGHGQLFSTGSDGGVGWIEFVFTLPADTPTGLAAISGLNAHVPVSWDAVTTSEVDGYRLYRNTDGYTTPIYDGSSLSFDDTGRTNGVTYSYKVTSYNADNESAKSGSVSATPAAAVISDKGTFTDYF